MAKSNDNQFLKEIDAHTFILTCCPYCKQLVPLGSYCASCGEVIQKTTRTLEVIDCPNCGKSTPSGGNFCVGCGAPLKAESADTFYSKENTQRLQKNAEEMDKTGGTIHEVD